MREKYYLKNNRKMFENNKFLQCPIVLFRLLL